MESNTSAIRKLSQKRASRRLVSPNPKKLNWHLQRQPRKEASSKLVDYTYATLLTLKVVARRHHHSGKSLP